MAMNDCYERNSPVDSGARLVVDCEIFATYLVIYMADPNELTSLALCEVEVIKDEGERHHRIAWTTSRVGRWERERKRRVEG